MTQYLTNRQLSAILADIQMWENNSPAFAIFMKEKIKRFRQQNHLRIQSLQDEFQKLIDKHVQKTPDGQPEIMALKDKQKFRFLDDEHENQYEEEYKKLMDKGFDVYL